MRNCKFRIYPSKSQIRLIEQQLEIHRQLYNICLEERRQQQTSCYNQITRHIKPLREANLLAKSCSYSSLQQTVRRVDKAFRSFFNPKTIARKPRFKNKLKSIEFGKSGDGWKLNTTLYVKGVGQIKIRQHHQVENPQRLILVKRGRKYYCTILDKTEINCNFSQSNKQIGIDINFKNFIVTSNNQSYKLPDFKKHYKEIAKSQRKKRKDVTAKIYNKINNKRLDFHHKLSNKLVKENQTIIMEDISFSNWKTKIPNINKCLYNLGICEFRTILSYKAESAGRKLVFVNPAYTSQRCFSCGRICKKSLRQRQHKCFNCDYKADRDVNAAQNILALGLHGLGNDGNFRFKVEGDNTFYAKSKSI